MTKKLLLISFLLFIFSLPQAFSQATIKGKIIDEKTNEPLIGATVVVKNTTVGTSAELDGSFSLKIEPGTKDLKFSYVGYISKELTVNVSGSETKDLGNIKLKSSSIGLDEVKVVANFARERETPVAVSKIQPIEIEEKLGTKELPELLKSTPSVYATKQGGGFGDSRINIRGFSQKNIAVLINGVPVNDMENGRVYWSNWANLADVTQTIQVQRGLGASRLAISSVGGTMNVITKSTDAEKGGSIYQAAGNDGYNKTSVVLSTGMMDNGWAVTVQGSKNTGDGFVTATNYESYSYFFDISKRINNQHRVSLGGFGAKQWHNQRSSPHSIETYRDAKNGIRFNSDYGIRKGEIYNTGYAYNAYHKPQFYLNHSWQISKKTLLHTSFYASFGRGGGRRVDGAMDHWLEFEYPSGEPYDITKITPDGLLDYNAVMEANANSMTGSQAVMSMAKNEHDWYGVLSTFNTKLYDVNVTAGFDGRYYKGYHYTEITDLLGGSYYLDNQNVNRDPDQPLYEGDKINYYNLGIVMREGIFLQGEYVKDEYSAFLSGTVSNKSYQRVDYFTYEEGNQVSDWESFIVYSVKGGVNYNINDQHNVFANSGYFTRAPFFTSIFKNYTNEINEEAELQKIFSTEIGYGYRTSKIKANLNVFRTRWMDKTITQTIGDVFANLTGLNALHKGVELELRYRPTQKINVTGMVSVGDYQWEDNVVADIFNEQQEYQGTAAVYAKNVHRGNTAQSTAYLGVDCWVLPDLKVGANIWHGSNIYAAFDVQNRVSKETEGVDSWKMPSYELVDANVKYEFEIANTEATLYGNVNNLLDTEYISDAKDGTGHNAETASVWYGWGRTWNLGLKIKF